MNVEMKAVLAPVAGPLPDRRAGGGVRQRIAERARTWWAFDLRMATNVPNEM
jgi:hypothetical protein